MSVSKDDLSFASAHFITLPGHRCEGLHGHNYRVRATIEGDLDSETAWVVDFIQLKDIMRRLCSELDHLVLLPSESRRLTVTEADGRVQVAVDGVPQYLFPRRDCVLLPLPNTTAEMLASLVADRLGTALDAAGARGIRVVEIEVEESPGQAAVCRLLLT